MITFKPGDIVNITIEGARVRAIRGEDIVDHLSYETEGFVASVALTESVTVEWVAPAEWPPRPGDLWRDQHGAVWFAADLVDDGGGPAIYMLASHDDHQVVPDYCNEKYGPLRLVHREDEQDGGAS